MTVQTRLSLTVGNLFVAGFMTIYGVSALATESAASSEFRTVRPVGDVRLTGEVRSDDGKPIAGVAIKVKDIDKGFTVTVFSKLDGSFQVRDLPRGTFDVVAQRMAYRTVTRKQVPLTSSSTMSFTMSRGPVNVLDPGLSDLEWKRVLPEGKYKARAILCGGCHTLSGLTARLRLDTAGWLASISKMESLGFFRGSKEDARGIADYLASVFGPEADLKVDLPPEDLGNHSLDINFVEYAVPTPLSITHTAYPDNRGNVWFSEYSGNKVGLLDVTTGAIREFAMPPYPGLVGAHGLTLDMAAGNVWYAGQQAGKIGRMNMKTKEFTEWFIPPSNNPVFKETKSGPHTPVVDSHGVVWFSSKNMLRKLDPKTGKVTEYPIEAVKVEAGATTYDSGVYSVVLDSKERVWFSCMSSDTVGFLDPATDKVTQFSMPPRSGPRRFKFDSKGFVWVGLWYSGNLAKIDPATGAVSYYNLPVRNSMPYALGIDKQDRIWINTFLDDKLVMFDPTTEKSSIYPLPHKGGGIRDFFMDSKGWMWGASFGRNNLIAFKQDSISNK